MTTVTESPANSPGHGERLVLDVVVPVRNEQADLGPCVAACTAISPRRCRTRFRITIADNASTDATPAIAASLAFELSEVRVLRVPGCASTRCRWTG